jgi:hypothetical protein
LTPDPGRAGPVAIGHDGSAASDLVVQAREYRRRPTFKLWSSIGHASFSDECYDDDHPAADRSGRETAVGLTSRHEAQHRSSS